eukprot:scaffold25527_cov31-Tisochrysis_lutea.AAC.5
MVSSTPAAVASRAVCAAPRLPHTGSALTTRKSNCMARYTLVILFSLMSCACAGRLAALIDRTTSSDHCSERCETSGYLRRDADVVLATPGYSKHNARSRKMAIRGGCSANPHWQIHHMTEREWFALCG